MRFEDLQLDEQKAIKRMAESDGPVRIIIDVWIRLANMHLADVDRTTDFLTPEGVALYDAWKAATTAAESGSE
jgi:hypothetical protein